MRYGREIKVLVAVMSLMFMGVTYCLVKEGSDFTEQPAAAIFKRRVGTRATALPRRSGRDIHPDFLCLILVLRCCKFFHNFRRGAVPLNIGASVNKHRCGPACFSYEIWLKQRGFDIRIIQRTQTAIRLISGIHIHST